MGIPTIGAKLPQLTLPGVHAPGFLAQSVNLLVDVTSNEEVGVSASVNSGVPHGI